MEVLRESRKSIDSFVLVGEIAAELVELGGVTTP